MNAIILAAGIGTRLAKYTKNLPKCMLNFNGKPLIQWQIDSLRQAGIEDIIVVGGYKAEALYAQGVTKLVNPAYASTNMVATLMLARDYLLKEPDGCLVCYGDIVYEPRLVALLKKGVCDVGVLVDDDWQPYWRARLDDWEKDIESLVFNSNDRILQIGKPECKLEEAMARYVGMLRFSAQGARLLANAFDKNRQRYWDSPTTAWRYSKSFKQAFMTCMLQELIDNGVDVRCIHTRHGWLEFDTEEDYERANQWLAEGTLDRFIRLNKT